MTKNDSPLFAPTDVVAAIGLMTRLPVKVDAEKAQSRGARAAWAYPVAGAIVALIAAALGFGLSLANLPAGIIAGAVLLTQVVVTGALHEDGLADTADGLWGGWTVERRLEIMKDSRIGTYGVLALVFSVLFRWSLLTALVATPHFFAALLVAATVSRAGMIGVMYALPNARKGGLSAQTGRPSVVTTAAGIVLSYGLALALFGFGGSVTLALASTVAMAGLGTIAKAKIGGQTGDVLGASQQVNEIMVLAALVALVV